MINRFALGLVFAAAVSSMVASAPTEELHSFVRGSWQQIRKAHSGVPTVIHFWGVTCGPCRVEMPQLGSLLKRRPDLNLVMINADLVPNEPSAVTAMLQEAGLASVENWIFDDQFVERLRFEIDPKWRGEIPITILVNQDGTTKTITGAADVNDIERWLDERAPAAK